MNCLLFLPLLLLTSAAWGKALDLTPAYAQTEAEGVIVKRAFFRDGPTRYAFRVDADLQLKGEASSAEFEFTKAAGASIRLRHSSLDPRKPFTEHAKDYLRAAEALLPTGATNVTVLAQAADPYPLNGWTGFQFVLSYSFYGQSVRTSVAFLNLDADQQLVVQATARERDFAEVSGRAFEILNSWHPLEAKETAREN